MGINKKFTAFTIRSHGTRLVTICMAGICTAALGWGFYKYFDYSMNYSPGWHTNEDGTYYIMRADHSRAVGMKLINNSSYLFSDKGLLLKGWQEYEGNTYYFDKAGVMQKGIIEIDGEEYYLSDESGIFKTGLQDFNGAQYYFDDHGFPGAGFDSEGGYYYDSGGKRIDGGWTKINGVQYYFFPDGENKGKMAKGWQWIKSEKDSKDYLYYFGIDGHMYTGMNYIDGSLYDFQEQGNVFMGWRQSDKDYMYADPETGAFAIGFTEIDGYTRYFDKDYHVVTGWTKIDGNTYYFNDKNNDVPVGAMAKGWFKDNGVYYYFDENGAAAKGFIKLGYDYYYFNNKNKLVYNWFTIGDDMYYSDTDGKVWQGFLEWKNGVYYFDQFTHKAVTGLYKTLDFTKEQNKTIKSFKDTLKLIDKYNKIDEKLKKKDDSMPIPPDEENYDLNNARSLQAYELDYNAYKDLMKKAGFSEKEVTKVDKLRKTYLSENSYEAMQLKAYKKFDEDLFCQHYFNDKYIMQVGWQEIDGYKFYFDPVTGEKLTGWQEIDGDRYYLGDFGICALGVLTVDGTEYDFGEDGKMPSGLIKSEGKLHYTGNDNEWLTNTFKKIGSKTYYFNENGDAVTGWIEIDEKLYYFDSDCALAEGLQRNENTLYYVTTDGVLKNNWLNTDTDTYYFLSEGNAATGWNTIGDIDYYFSDDGKLQKGWTTISGKKYYLENGTVIRGPFWVNEDDDETEVETENEGEYYVIGNDGYVKEGWIIWNNRSYYTDSDGRPLVNTTEEIDGIRYTFDKEGVMILQTQ